MATLYTKLLIQKQVPKSIKQVAQKNVKPRVQKKVDWTTPKKFRNRLKQTWVDKQSLKYFTTIML